MRTLAIDSSSMTGSVALLDDEVLIGEYLLSLKRTHSERLLPALDGMLGQAGMSVRDVDLLAVTLGPGSYTGLRIGLGTAKGLAFALDKPIVGVSTLEALAEGAGPWPGVVAAIVDARHGNVFAAAYAAPAAGGLLRPVREERYGPLSRFASEMAAAARPTLLVGDAVQRYAEDLGSLFPGASMASPLFAQVRAAHVGQIARRRFLLGQLDDPATLLPRYLRASEAEVRREEARCGTGDDSPNGPF